MDTPVPHLQYEANIDDMDPRLWPTVIDKLLAAGAQDAWVTPILMKKGRPAFTLGVLCGEAAATEVRATVFRETTTLGIRELPIQKYVLDRAETKVDVDGVGVGVKWAFDGDLVMNRSVEWDDVVAASESLGLSAKDVLAAAEAAAWAQSAPHTSTE